MAEFIKQSWVFPVLQSVHILGITLLVGTIALVDFRLLGMGMRRHTARDLTVSLSPWTSAGLLTVLITGPVLFGSDLSRYMNNPAFLLKIGLLSAALTLHFTLHRGSVVGSLLKPFQQKLVGLFSLSLWSSVILAGRAIADFDIRPT